MRQVREVLRLKHVCGHSGHQIAAMIGVSRYTVAEYLRRARVAGIAWPVPPELDDAALERKLFTPPFTRPELLRPQPEWARIHAELRRPGVTLMLLWEEYAPGTRMATATAGSVSSTLLGLRAVALDATDPPCGGEAVYRLLRADHGGIEGATARCGGRRSSWRRWAHPTRPMPRRA